MRKVDTISAFILGKFGTGLSSVMRTKMLEQETKIKDAIRQISELDVARGLTDLQRESGIDGLRRSLRRLEDRKAYYYKKIQSLKNIDSGDFEKLLKKNPKYDYYFIDKQGRLNIYTKTLKDGARNIGKFRVCIFDNQETGVNFKALNLSYHTRSYDHWAISSLRCCMGEWAPDFEKSLWSGDIPEFFNLFVHYIEMSPAAGTYFGESKNDWYKDRLKRSTKTSEKYREMDIELISTSADEEYEETDPEESEDEYEETTF